MSTSVLTKEFERLAERNAQLLYTDEGAGENIVAQPVFRFIMRIAIDLDDQLDRRAAEIGNEMADHLLAAKFEPAELAVRQMPPQPLLGLGRIAAHIRGTAMQLGEAFGR